MFNTKRPSLEELPSSAQLIRSTVIAGASAAVILVTVVLPAEYGIDPTGIGRALGLKEMGEIKTQLADEAEADRELESQDQSSLLNNVLGLFVGSAHAQEAEVWQDETSFILTPGDSAEWKLVMDEGATAEYRMIVTDGRVNFDLHGHGGGKSITYEKGRGSTGAEGIIEAAFDGEHGWFWRNRDSGDVSVMVQVRGDYSEIVE
ncbi:transmembrane anchor protein [Ruegeria sp. Ofav3-42]|uniref:transmembrane anchor protein n=1 Tax=Ruegeria sp. Ofav3-42 TaxID=2917759 RepID=UPI001EF629ED|nr:transmembrane anchor protein [Ruegeria sp. Ofav3-42]MCG7522611.1 transmembrane anchor protein [Ruegeria sp. Ofav3-42]